MVDGNDNTGNLHYEDIVLVEIVVLIIIITMTVVLQNSKEALQSSSV